MAKVFFFFKQKKTPYKTPTTTNHRAWGWKRLPRRTEGSSAPLCSQEELQIGFCKLINSKGELLMLDLSSLRDLLTLAGGSGKTEKNKNR